MLSKKSRSANSQEIFLRLCSDLKKSNIMDYVMARNRNKNYKILQTKSKKKDCNLLYLIYVNGILEFFATTPIKKPNIIIIKDSMRKLKSHLHSCQNKKNKS